MKNLMPAALPRSPAFVALLLFAIPTSGQMRWESLIPFVETDATSAEAGDLDGDGLIDVALTFSSGRVSLLLGDGSGAFTRATSIEGIGANAILLRDFDLDGFDDAVVLASQFGSVPSRVTFLFSDRRGGVRARLDVPLAGFSSDIDVADMDGDGWPDLVAALVAGAQMGIQVLYGTAGAFPRSRVVAAGVRTNFVSVADVNGDSLPDLVTYQPTSATVNIRLAAPGSSYPVASAFVAASGILWQLRAIGGDGDGPAEIACCFVDGEGGNQTDLFRGSVAAGFARVYATTGRSQPSASFADLDGDGRRDLLVGGWESRAHFATPLGGFVPSAVAGTRGRTVVTADVDADGLPDIVSATGVFLNRCHDARRGTVDASGGREPFDVLIVNGSPGEGPSRTITVSRGAPITVQMATPPSRARGTAPFCLYAWATTARPWDPVPGNPFDIGPLSLPTPLTGGSPQPAAVWNNFPGARAARLGAADRLSLPAPSTVVVRPGIRQSGAIFLQGVIRDSQSPNGIAAATNAIQVIVR